MLYNAVQYSKVRCTVLPLVPNGHLEIFDGVLDGVEQVKVVHKVRGGLGLEVQPGLVGVALLEDLLHLLPGQLGQDRIELVDTPADRRQRLLLHPDEVQLEDADGVELGEVLGLGLLLLEVGQEGAEEVDLRVVGEIGLQVGRLVLLEVLPGLVEVVEVAGAHVE